MIRSDTTRVDLYITISASDRNVFSVIFKRDMNSRRALARRRDAVVKTVLRGRGPRQHR